MHNPVGIISDTHDHREHIEAAVRVLSGADCSMVIHAGDYVAPFTASVFERLACPFIGVFGNNDGERRGLVARYGAFGELHEPPYEFTHRGRRFALMHEPVYLDRYRGRADIDVVVYGHTHMIVIEPGHPLVINPGEVCSWITGRSTVVLLDPETLETKIVELRP